MPRSKFRPTRYNEPGDKVGSTSFRDINGLQLFTKGSENTIKIEVSFLESIIDTLYNAKDQRIDNFNDEVAKSAFDNIYTFTRLLYDFESYQVIRDMVDKRFKDLNQCQPLTVGWYMKGHSSNVSGVPAACNLFNSSALYPTDKTIPLNCEHSVILAEYNEKEGSKLTTLSHREDSKKAFLYVNSYDISNVAGFTKIEKELLTRTLGIDTVFLYGYTTKYGDIKLLLDREIKVNDLKSRAENESHNTSNSAVWALALIIIIVIILIILFAFWR